MDSFKKKKKKAKIWHIWPTFPPGNQQPAWQLPALYLQVCALQLTTAPPGPLHFFDIDYLGPSGPEFGGLELHTASNHEPHGFILLYFPFNSFLYLLAVLTP